VCEREREIERERERESERERGGGGARNLEVCKQPELWREAREAVVEDVQVRYLFSVSGCGLRV